MYSKPKKDKQRKTSLTELELIFNTPIRFGLYAQGHIPTIEH